MSVGLPGGQRSRRSPKRRFGRFLDFQIGAAESVLAAVAIVLVVWLLWPEDHGPRLENRSARQNSVEEGERRRVELKPVPSAERALDDILRKTDSPELQGEEQSSATGRVAETERRQIATPSEFADRLAARSVQPAPERPAYSTEKAVTEEATAAETAVAITGASERSPTTGLIPPEKVEAALTNIIDRLKQDDVTEGDIDAPTLAADGTEPDDVAPDGLGLSSETLQTEPLPEVDLSDLDTLVPLLEEAEVAALDPAISTEADIASTTDAAIESFVVERDPSVPTSNVRARPRDDAPTWLRNAVTAAVDDERPIIAIVIDDLGLNRRNTAALNNLPSPLTLAFLPYAGRIEAQTEAAQAAGHELMLHLPMEPLGSEWPGPDALTTRIDQEEFTARLIKNLDRFDGFVGINNHMGSRLTADSSRMDVVMQELRKRDVLFLDSKTSARSIAGDIAGRHGVPNTTRDIFLDNVNDAYAIKRQLARAERVARESGSAVAIGHPYDATIQALRDWIPSLEARGFALAPISAVVARRACKSGVLIADETCGRYLQVRKPASPAIAATDS